MIDIFCDKLKHLVPRLSEFMLITSHSLLMSADNMIVLATGDWGTKQRTSFSPTERN